MTTQPQKQFKAILIDPPTDVNQKGRYGAAAHYDLMSIPEICAMGEMLRAITAEDCWLFVWMTNKVFFEHGKEMLRAWGFDYRGVMTWFKCKNNGLGKPWRNSTEQLVLASRGKPEYAFKNQATHLFAPTQDHSHKPEEQYAILDRFMGDFAKDGEKAELFARRSAPGWLVWGNEADSDFSLAEYGYSVPSDAKFENANLTHESTSTREDS